MAAQPPGQPPGVDYVAILNAVTPLIINLAPLVAQAIATVSSQSGKEVESIISEVAPQLDANEAKLFADLAKEQAAISGGAQ